jgi:hypothetical protein
LFLHKRETIGGETKEINWHNAGTKGFSILDDIIFE